MRVLIVEDTETIVLILKIYINSWGVPVEFIHAKNGHEGLKLASENKPDLIISDIQMPVLDGFQFCLSIRSIPSLKDVPVVLLTSLKEEGVESKGRIAGATEFLQKPITPTALRARLGKYLGLPSEGA